MEFQTINLDMIDPNPNQPRKDFGDDSLQELAESIKQVGVLVPLLVRPLNGRYEIVHGERRWRASKMASLDQVPARVQPLTDTEAFIISLNENLQRQNLNPIEEAQAYQWLQEQGYNQSKIADIIGKSQQYVASRIVLLNLPQVVKEKITTRVVSASHGEVLASLKSATLAKKLAKQVEKDRLTVRQLEGAMRSYKRLDEGIERVERLGITPPKVSLSINHKGKVSIPFRINYEIEQVEETATIQRQGYYVRYWSGCLPKIEDNSYELVNKEEWELAHKFYPDEYYEIYWGDKFERTRQPEDGDLGEEVTTHFSVSALELRYILPVGRWGWYDFPIERVGKPQKVSYCQRLQWPEGIPSAKVVRRRVFCPYIMPSDEYMKLLAVLSGDFYYAGALAIFQALSWTRSESTAPKFDRHFPYQDDIVPKRRVMTALKKDLQLTDEPSWQEVAPFLTNFRGNELNKALESRPDVFENIRSLAKSMSEDRRGKVGVLTPRLA